MHALSFVTVTTLYIYTFVGRFVSGSFFCVVTRKSKVVHTMYIGYKRGEFSLLRKCTRVAVHACLAAAKAVECAKYVRQRIYIKRRVQQLVINKSQIPLRHLVADRFEAGRSQTCSELKFGLSLSSLAAN